MTVNPPAARATAPDAGRGGGLLGSPSRGRVDRAARGADRPRLVPTLPEAGRSGRPTDRDARAQSLVRGPRARPPPARELRHGSIDIPLSPTIAAPLQS